MANKNSSKKNFLNYLLIGLVAVSVLLLLSQIVTNTTRVFQANKSNEGYAVYVEYDSFGKIIEVEPTPRPTRDPALPTPTYDITEGE